MAAEFEKKDADAAIATMTDNPTLIHVPVNTGATGKENLRRFYRDIFIPQMPEDIDMQLLTRSVGQNRIIDEFIIRFTHTVRMEWFAPGVKPTDRKIVLPHVAVIAFADDKIKSEHIYWDQGSALMQLGLLHEKLPVTGSDQCERLLNINAPVNQLIQ
ncbi:nuclear transport factor 2 family protein [Microbulbifer epialgicus]|uniref:Nuclear transport factor 2 family protein n=2 Tax=Microbulbifer epialgicus TaxID=393907 RepID=A0ABV4NVF6_9GAMM